MSRTSWFDEDAEHPAVLERVNSLESFTSAIADGLVDNTELIAQEKRLVSAMKHLEAELSDDLHAKVTDVLVELTAYNLMRLLHDLQSQRARIAFGK